MPFRMSVDALQLAMDSSNAEAVADFCQGRVSSDDRCVAFPAFPYVSYSEFVLHPGDWVIRLPEMFIRCGSRQFAAQFEEI